MNCTSSENSISSLANLMAPVDVLGEMRYLGNLRVMVDLNRNVSLSHLTLHGYWEEALKAMIRGLSGNREWWMTGCPFGEIQRQCQDGATLEHPT